jgi:hypothetical protein
MSTYTWPIDEERLRDEVEAAKKRSKGQDGELIKYVTDTNNIPNFPKQARMLVIDDQTTRPLL